MNCFECAKGARVPGARPGPAAAARHDACYCGQLGEQLSLAQATVSQPLKVLKNAGLIVGEIEGLHTCYYASRKRLVELHDLLEGMLDEAVEVDTSGCD